MWFEELFVLQGLRFLSPQTENATKKRIFDQSKEVRSMSKEAEELIKRLNEAGKSPSAVLGGVGVALRCLVSWVLSIELRVAKMETSATLSKLGVNHGE